MKPKEMIAIAKGVISNPNYWVKGVSKTQRQVHHTSPHTYENIVELVNCYCASGAIDHVAHEFQPPKNSEENEERLKTLLQVRNFMDIQARSWLETRKIQPDNGCYTIILNDHENTTHADIMKFFDDCIENIDEFYKRR